MVKVRAMREDARGHARISKSSAATTRRSQRAVTGFRKILAAAGDPWATMNKC